MHTRWIETEMQQSWAAAPRPDAVPDAPLHRSCIEIDGKRVVLGLPASLLQGLGRAGSVQASAAPLAPAVHSGDLVAPMAGSLVAWKVLEGAQVREGDVLALIESMKMETPILATAPGTIQIQVQAGAVLQAGQVIAKVA